jgi:hypothetical protein
LELELPRLLAINCGSPSPNCDFAQLGGGHVPTKSLDASICTHSWAGLARTSMAFFQNHRNPCVRYDNVLGGDLESLPQIICHGIKLLLAAALLRTGFLAGEAPTNLQMPGGIGEI